MNLWKTAWRNVWRNKRRSVVTMAAMTLALFVLILYSGLIAGYLKGMENNVLDLEVGDIQIYAPTFLDRPSKYTTIGDSDRLLDELDQAGIPACARLIAGALAGAQEASAGVSLRGIDVERDARVLRIHEAVAVGSWLDPGDPTGVVLGRRLAKTLLVEPGDELVVLTQAMDGGIADNLYHVRGILKGIADGTDRSAVFMTEDAFRELMAFPRGAHQILVRRPAQMELDVVAERIRGLAPDLDVRTWKQLMPVVAQMLDSTEGLILVVFSIVYLAVGILILNAMLMAVFERIREFGVFKAIGGGPGQVFALILVEAVVQIGIATVIGVALAVPGMWYLSRHGIQVGSMAGMSVIGVAMDPIWYGIYTGRMVLVPVVMLFVMALAAVLYPALKAAWIRPVQAMRYQ